MSDVNQVPSGPRETCVMCGTTDLLEERDYGGGFKAVRCLKCWLAWDRLLVRVMVRTHA